MRGYFEEEEPKAEQPRRDRELTLGAGAVFSLFVALALVCGLCFGVGYAVGHHGSAPSAAAGGPTPAPDQEPLQGNNSIPKPSAAETSAVPAADSSTTPDAVTPGAGAGANPAAAGQGQAVSGQTPGAATPGAGAGNTGPGTQGGVAANVQPALPAQVLMVQIAAVANAEDAGVLETALRKRGYAVTAQRNSADGLIHVRIGPFSSSEEAIHWRDKLLGDGYNAVVQP
jgi:cell division septation protein DedD